MVSSEFVYSTILDKLGYFEPKSADYRIDPGYKGMHVVSGNVTEIGVDTLVVYYPGSFGLFHEGHISVVNEVISRSRLITDNYVVVISPANSDYLVSKYGRDSLCARNDFRFKQICEALEGVVGNIVIDLGPMLNSVCDVNFPRLVKDFVEVQTGCDFGDMLHKPTVVFGKDRKDYVLMGDIVDYLDFMYVSDTTGASTSKMLKGGDIQFKKKKVVLRYSKPEELHLFEQYFGECYEEVVPLLFCVEVETVKNWISSGAIDLTICKDYVGLGVPYYPLSRKFKHALDIPTTYTHSDNLDVKGKVVLDSDVYSGETRRYIESLGGKLVWHTNLEHVRHDWDIVDFSDFKTGTFNYPHKDVAVRCSMPAFSYEDHINYREFLGQVDLL